MAERVVLILACSECKDHNYHRVRGKKKQEVAKLEIRKFCPACGRHTLHKETKP